jgi:hypothetical protein
VSTPPKLNADPRGDYPSTASLWTVACLSKQAAPRKNMRHYYATDVPFHP